MTSRTLRASVAAAALATAAAVGCDDSAPHDRHPRPDILLVTFDTLRADHCSVYGYERATTPTLEAMQTRGVRFETAYAPTATTAPSHATLLTALDPLAHGVRRNGIVLDPSFQTLPETLREHGYRTAGFTSSFVVNHKFGFGQGFEHFDDDFTDPERPDRRTRKWNDEWIPGGVFRRPADETTDRAIAWLDRPTDGAPRFVWVHFIDPHEPYEVPPSWKDPFGAEALPPESLEQIVARYDTLVRHADDQLGRLIARMEQGSIASGLLVIVTADHGEAFLEHGWRSHGVQIFEESVKVPLLWRWEGQLAAGRVVLQPASLQDLTPTILGLIGMGSTGTGWAGRDLAPLLRSQVPENLDLPIFVQRQSYENDGLIEAIALRDLGGKTFGRGVEVRGEMFGVRAGRWKYIEAPQEIPARQLFDLATDPRELQNLTAQRGDVARSLARQLSTWRRALPEAEVPSPEISAADQSALEALGYKSALPPEERRAD